MRSVRAMLIASLFIAGLAGAQMKQQPPQQPIPQTAVEPMRVPPPQMPMEAPQDGARRIARDEAIKLVKSGKAVFVDVRGKDQYAAGHIKGALGIPEAELVTRLREIPPRKMIITYCA
jgi:hypothetical protein